MRRRKTAANKEKPKIVIRKTNKIDVVHRLDVEIFPEDAYSELLNVVWFVAWADNKPVGFAGLKATGGGNAFLIRCGVIKDYRGFGLQKRLLDIREKAAKHADITRIYTYTVASNIYSSNNLIKSGYLMYDSEYNDEPEMIYWEKFLKSKV